MSTQEFSATPCDVILNGNHPVKDRTIAGPNDAHGRISPDIAGDSACAA